MNLVVNGRALGRPLSGVERYAQQMVACMQDRVRVCVAADRSPLAQLLWEQAGLPGLLNDDDWLWSPANSGPIAVRRQLLTLHDVAPLDHPEWYRPAYVIWCAGLWRILSRRVQVILTDSNFSRSRIGARLKVPLHKIHMIPVGVDSKVFHPSGPGRFAGQQPAREESAPYILFVGTFQPRKNIPVLLEAWSKIHRQRLDLRLMMVGAPGRLFRNPRLKRLPPGVQIVERLSDIDLAGLYRSATLYIQPSLYEGAALTALEAQACGCPVVAADIPAFREYLSGSAAYFRPTVPNDLAESALDLLENPARRSSLREDGLRQAGRYSWEASAEKLWDLAVGLSA